MSLLETREASLECARVISARPYENYTIFGNVLSFENPETMQPNPMYLLADRDSDPAAVATVEDGKRSTEIALFTRDTCDARSIFDEAMLLAGLLHAPALQVVTSSAAQERLLDGTGLGFQEAGTFLVLTLEIANYRSPPGPRPLDAITSLGGLPVRHPRTITRTLVEDGRVVCLGRAEPRGECLYEICDLFTVPERRGQGLASGVAAWLCEHVISKGCIPVYVVSDANLASRRVAAHLGFSDSARFDVHSMHKGSRLNRVAG
jgi:GNAT superfamily N-acetyltransferase